MKTVEKKIGRAAGGRGVDHVANIDGGTMEYPLQGNHKPEEEPPRKSRGVLPERRAQTPANFGKTSLLNSKQIAESLGVKESTIRYWVHIGYIPHIKFPGAVRFDLAVIENWLVGRQKGGSHKGARDISADILRKEKRLPLDRQG